MEEPECEPEHVGGVEQVDKKDDALTASHSSEDSDSWTVLGKENVRLNREPSGVQEIIKEEVSVTEGKVQRSRKQRNNSHRSNDSQLDESSDGISIISDSDASSLLMEDESHDDQGSTVHFFQNIDLKAADYEPLTPPFTPDEVKSVKEDSIEQKQELQMKHPDENSMETVRSMVEHSAHAPVSNTKWIIFSLIATGMVAVILGNSMRLQNHVDEINFEHEKRISELELENNILKKEMNKLRHLYTRSELDEQVQRAEFEWIDALKGENLIDSMVERMETIPKTKTVEADETIQQPIRKVPPQDSDVKRKVVWSGDEEEPMLIVDKDYVLPSFCYNQDQAVHDDLFSEYSAKYCDVRKRKIDAKQKKAEFQLKKQSKQENYNKFINPVKREQSHEKRIDPNKPASPFNIDYQKALDAIKAESSVIVDALGSILDLSPEPEDSLGENIIVPPAVTTPEVRDSLEDQLTSVPKKGGEVKRTQEFAPQGNKQESRQENRGMKKTPGFVPKGHKQESKEQIHDDNKQKMNRPKENKIHRKEGKSRSSDEKEYKKIKDSSNRSMYEGYHKHKKDREENGKYESKEKKKEHGSYVQKKNVEDFNHKNGPEERTFNDGKRKAYQEKKHRYPDMHNSGDHGDDDEDDDDHFKKKFVQHETLNDRNHYAESFDTSRVTNHESAREGSYLEQYKQAELKKATRHDADDIYENHKHHEQHAYKQYQNQHNGDWSEKRYKGRDEYRQNGGKRGERGSGEQHWQERMKHGRQEAKQRKKMESENNWFLERGNHREEGRIFHHSDSGAR